MVSFLSCDMCGQHSHLSSGYFRFELLDFVAYAIETDAKKISLWFVLRINKLTVAL